MTSTLSTDDYAAKLRQLRLDSGLSQQQAAELTGVSLRMYCYFEAGARTPMPAAYWEKKPSQESILRSIESFASELKKSSAK